MNDKATEPYVIRRGSFSWALEEMKRGICVMRRGEKRFIVLADCIGVEPNVRTFNVIDIPTRMMLGGFRPDFVDLMADDWMIYNGDDNN